VWGTGQARQRWCGKGVGVVGGVGAGRGQLVPVLHACGAGVMSSLLEAM